jgi:predicted AAA+ superfamily ATPase
MQGYINRNIEVEINENLNLFPSVALLGPRQCGKSTLAKQISKGYNNCLYLDLESIADLRKLEDPELYLLSQKDKFFIIDEIQRKPDLFTVLRSIIDKNNRNNQFLILGSASRELIKQSSESLAGRIYYMELYPFIYSELFSYETEADYIKKLWIRGGFPRSYLSINDKTSYKWRDSFIKTYLERDISMLGFNISASILDRFWRMLSHSHGQLLNSSKIGESLGVSHTTIRSYIEILKKTYMIRELLPYETNLKKRLIKSSKIYIRDSGILHTLLEIEDINNLYGHPIFGFSWEGFIIENIMNEFPGYKAYFYRTSSGAEVDLILEKGLEKIIVECKSTVSPVLSKGFWNALNDIKPKRAWVICPINDCYPIKENVFVSSLEKFIEYYSKVF